MIVVIDNYDSFTYNLVQYLGELGEQLQVFRNDKTTVESIAESQPDRIVVARSIFALTPALKVVWPDKLRMTASPDRSPRIITES